jgi:hypothetical protein
VVRDAVSDPRPALAAGRIAHAALMLDAVHISRPGAYTWDPNTQTNTTPQTVVYDGSCRLVVWRGSEEEAAETEVNVARLRLDLPLTDTTPEVQRRDIATITASSNPWLIGRVLVVTEVQLATTATALQVIAEFVT